MKITILSALCLLPPLCASDSRLDRETLRGVKTLYVVVAVERNYGLNGGQIESDVAGRLRAAGIQVADMDRSSMRLPCLFVSVNILKRSDGSWVYEASVALDQAVTIVANQMPYMAPTWSAEALSVASGPEAPRFVRTDIDGLTARFIHAYLEAHEALR